MQVLVPLLLFLGLLLSHGHAAVVCDGTNDVLTAANEAAFDLSNTSFTLTAWIKTNDATSITGVLTKNAPSSGGWDLGLHNGAYYMTIREADNGLAAQAEYSSTSHNNQWRHIAIVNTTSTTVSATNAVQVYVDAVSTQGATLRDGQGYGPANEPFRICARGTTQFTAMTVQDVRVWQGALTAQQIAILASSKRSYVSLAMPSVAYYPLESCAHGTSTDTTVFPDRGSGANALTATQGTCDRTFPLIRTGVW